jgi:DNA (cytosine-5)-methyltransferase 1
MTNKQITIGSLFSGIGGFELGLERAIPNSKTIWQCEQNAFAQKVLKKHWPDVPIYDDIKEMKHDTIDIVDIICGGFPCQDISQAGKGKGIANGERSGLWFEMLRIIDIVRPRIAIAENVTAITQKGRGMDIVISSLAKIGYDVEWIDVRASDEGAPHKRERIFFVAYPNQTTIFKPKTPEKIDRISQTRKTNIHTSNRSENGEKNGRGADIFNRGCNILSLESKNTNEIHTDGKFGIVEKEKRKTSKEVQHKTKHSNESWNTNPIDDGTRCETTSNTIGERTQISIEGKHPSIEMFGSQSEERRVNTYWSNRPIESPICRVDDGIPNRVDRIKALGNAIVPQCSETIGRYIMKSGILDDIEEYRKIQKEINNIPW